MIWKLWPALPGKTYPGKTDPIYQVLLDRHLSHDIKYG